MKKIISLFKRDYEGTRQVFNEVLSGAEWVTNGEGVATVKIDGTSCLVRAGKLFKRYDAKAGKTPPVGFEPAQEPDLITGHHPGWLPVSESDNGDRWHREAFAQYENLADGTYELIGEKVQSNPYGITGHKLIRHGEWLFESEPPRTFDELKKWFETNNVEGIVWHHPSGDMVKIKRKDFGIKWGGSVSKSAT
jgi:hypothetical protein